MQNNRYSDQLAAASPVGLGIQSVSDNGFYDIAIQLAADGAGYTATAAPRPGGGQTDDEKCRVFTVDHNLRKSARDGADADVTRECWR